MATQWVLGKITDTLQPTIQSAVGTAGSLAGGAMNTVGSSINGVGERLNSGIRYYGDGAKDYGNSIMDWSKAPAARAQTANNPLGLSKTSAAGRASATSPSLYRAPSSIPKSASKTLPGQRSTPATVNSVTMTAKKHYNPTANSTLARKSVVANNKPQPKNLTKLSSIVGSNGTKKTISPASRPQVAVTPTSAGATRSQNTSSAAANR